MFLIKTGIVALACVTASLQEVYITWPSILSLIIEPFYTYSDGWKLPKCFWIKHLPSPLDMFVFIHSSGLWMNLYNIKQKGVVLQHSLTLPSVQIEYFRNGTKYSLYISSNLYMCLIVFNWEVFIWSVYVQR